MKRKILQWSLAISALALIFVISCKKEDSILGCPSALSNVTQAASDFNSSMTKANCEAYKSALQDYINTCNPGSYYQTTYDDLDCSIYN